MAVKIVDHSLIHASLEQDGSTLRLIKQRGLLMKTWSIRVEIAMDSTWETT